MDNLLFNFYNVVNNIWINIINDEFFINGSQSDPSGR